MRSLTVSRALSAAIALLLFMPTTILAGTLLVANKSSATVTLLDSESGAIETVLATGTGPHEVDVSPDGRTAVVANYGSNVPGNSLTIIDIPTSRVVGTIELGKHTRPHGLDWLADNRRIAVTTEGSGSLLVVDVVDGKIEQAYPTDQELSHMVAVSEPEDDRNLVAFVSSIGSGSVTRIELGDDRIVSRKIGGGAEGIAVSPDGKTVWVASRDTNELHVLAADTLATLETLETGEFPIRVEFTHDGQHVAVTNAKDDTLGIYNAATMTFERNVPLGVEGGKGASIFGEFAGSVPIGIQAAPGKLWIAHANGDRVSEIDTATWAVTRLIDAGKEPDGMAWSPLEAGSVD